MREKYQQLRDEYVAAAKTVRQLEERIVGFENNATFAVDKEAFQYAMEHLIECSMAQVPGTSREKIINAIVTDTCDKNHPRHKMYSSLVRYGQEYYPWNS